MKELDNYNGFIGKHGTYEENEYKKEMVKMWLNTDKDADIFKIVDNFIDYDRFYSFALLDPSETIFEIDGYIYVYDFD